MEATTDTSPEQCLMAAVRDYIGRGWRVIPLHTPRPTASGGGCSCGDKECANVGKHPRTRNGLKDATGREAVAKVWWHKWRNANVAIATGKPSGLLVLDIDPRHGGDTSLLELEERYGPLPLTLTALTGGGGQHRLFAHPGGDVLLRNTNLMRLLDKLDGKQPRPADEDGLDVRGDGGYVVAAPSLHESGAHYEWQDAAIPVAPLPDWLLTLLMQPRGGVSTETPATQAAQDRQCITGDRDADARYWLDKYASQASDGNRNETGKDLALQLRDSARLTESEAEAYMLEYAERVPSGGKPYTAREALATLRSIYRQPAREPARNLSRTQAAITEYPGHAPYADATALPAYDVLASDELEATPERTGRHSADTTAGRAQKPRSRFQLLTDVEVERMPPTEWLIAGILPESLLSMVFGEYGSGKSFFTLDLALCVAAGVPFHGRKVKQGAVVYVAGEGVSGMRKRLMAWKQAHGLADQSLPFYLISEPPRLMRADDVASFINAVQDIPNLRMIALDTLSRCIVGGDENSSKDMPMVVDNLSTMQRMTKAHVLVVHHKPKNATGPRGSTSVPGGVDTLIDVTKDNNTIWVRCTKQKDADTGKAIAFTLQSRAIDQDGRETSCVLVPVERKYSGREAPADIMLRILAAHDDGMFATNWEREAFTQGVARSTFYENQRRLERDNRIENVDGLWMIASPSPTESNVSPS